MNLFRLRGDFPFRIHERNERALALNLPPLDPDSRDFDDAMPAFRIQPRRFKIEDGDERERQHTQGL